ncbi:aspartate-alanine antiporter [Paenibacillus sp. N1-5-1-14]|uniref:aspartate-alanine antiporter n=1 Tax=Paenibacillus radicibacter TaxID=2972488 RepID=UPI0021599469|nr:aspartate-alanine antiporter [Paenibacillus radicibacter]MCR8642786.1 aspartate-alanine antiporter [Paenibacillus radicibacter]
MNWIVDVFTKYPELAVFLTLSVGYFIGKLKIGSFSLGSVTGVLLVGVLVGQLHISVSPTVKAVFFLLFLFAMGYKVGPQFVHGLKKDGLPQVLFAVIVCVTGLLSAYGASLILGFNAGQGAGLLSGALTQSSVIGVASDALMRIGMPADQEKMMISYVVVGYAITYIFGTVGAAYYCSNLGPKILGVNLVEECKKLEAEVGATQTNTEITSGYEYNVYRAYRVDNPLYIEKTVKDIEKDFLADKRRNFIVRVKHQGKIVDATPETVIHKGDVVVVSILSQNIPDLLEHAIGEEVFDADLFEFDVETLEVVVTNSDLVDKTIRDLAFQTLTRAVFVKGITRQGEELPFKVSTPLHRGDVVLLTGTFANVEAAAKKIGYAAHKSFETDMVYVGLGVLLGGLIGIPALKIAGIPISLTTSGGALIMGLLFGWIRSLKPTFGRIPEGAIWVFNNVGLTTFVAVVGINAGPGFVDGLKHSGVSTLIAGIVVTLLPLFVGTLLGKYVFKFHPAITLGAIAGSQTTTAAIGALTEAAKSQVPVLGYTVTYAVGNILITVWGAIIVALLT